MLGRVQPAVAGARALARVRAAWWPCAQAAVAAALAWLIAHRALGHSQPFFAPIAAAISLSISHTQRSRRILQMVAGVLIGIGVGEGLQSVLGTSTAALGVITLVTFLVALALGAGLFGEGMMFPNQAAASAVLVVTLHRHGTGSERVVDVLVGGGVSLVIGVGLLPAEPMSLLREAERDVIRILAETLGAVATLLEHGEGPEEGWTLERSYALHQRLAGLARARSTAHLNVRVAPRRWRLRAAIDAEVRRTAQLDLLANATLSLVRALTAGPEAGPPPAAGTRALVGVLAGALHRLAEAPTPWAPGLIGGVVNDARAAIVHVSGHPLDRGSVIDAILGATAADLLQLVAPGDVPSPQL